MIRRSWPTLMSACLSFWSLSSSARAESVAFFYGAELPRELLFAYDQVVVEPSQISDVAALSHGRAALVAYFSVGEAADADTRPIPPSWVIGRNSAWQSRILDLTQPGYRSLVLERFELLWRAGYRRFFLDTLDSYMLARRDPQPRAAQRDGLTQLIRALAQRHPEAKFLLNRGFELLPDVAGLVHGVVAESLFDGFDAAKRAYSRVPEADRAWLLARLREVQTRYALPVIVIDYRPAAERDQARETARRISALGFTPWVCSGQLAEVGIGALEILPRRVLIVAQGEAATRPGTARWLSPVLEYLGYVPEYSSPSELPGLSQPGASLSGRYAGIVTVLDVEDAGADYEAWLTRQVDAGVRVAIFGSLGFQLTSPLARALGIEALQSPLPGEYAPRTIAWSTRDALIGFEAEPPLHALQGVPLSLSTTSTRHLEIRLASGQSATAIATTSWGGLARSHVFAPRGLHGQRAWVLDPFAFLTRALALPQIPVPDVTTESGGRVALFAIDVQGAGQRARTRGRPLVSEQLLEVLAAQRWPHALGVSAETDAADVAALKQLLTTPGVYPDAISVGTTAARGPHASLTQVAPLYAPGAPDPISSPIAPDSSFLEGSSEAYAYERVLRTLQFTDLPRRLSPIALHYHAYAASSPGGADALGAIYTELARQPLFAVRLGDYRERVLAFREQVIARDLRGNFLVFAGLPLRTLRVPAELGPLDLARSRGVASVAMLQQGRYVTFASDGPRSLTFQQSASLWPHLELTNGRIEWFLVTGTARAGWQVDLSASADEPLVLRFAGLRPSTYCTLSYLDQRQRTLSDPGGRAQFALKVTHTGPARLTCPLPSEIAAASGG